jgi:undecaprenyl-diphosphatase
MSLLTIPLFLKAVLIAVVEGLTEFIPISSTGHMILLGHFIDFTGDKADTFKIFIQGGAILAVVFLYWERFVGLIPRRQSDHQTALRQLFLGKRYPNGLQFLLAIVPIMLVGLFLYGTIREYLFNPLTVAAGLITGGVMMILVEYLPIPKTVTSIKDLRYGQALIIGLGQCLSVWPGMSRSGSTMITGLLIGVRHKVIADFSFMIAVPVMLAAVGYDLLKSWHFLNLQDAPVFISGFVIAFAVALISIKWFLKVLERLHLVPFGIYRILIGIVSLWLFYGNPL